MSVIGSDMLRLDSEREFQINPGNIVITLPKGTYFYPDQNIEGKITGFVGGTLMEARKETDLVINYANDFFYEFTRNPVQAELTYKYKHAVLIGKITYIDVEEGSYKMVFGAPDRADNVGTHVRFEKSKAHQIAKVNRGNYIKVQCVYENAGFMNMPYFNQCNLLNVAGRREYLIE
ncbi:OB-fold protein [Allochromatium vinosum]|uniref:OB-fold protein n=1 Tax=Allochromatium vinosum TaxID=1049 RepID=UPI001906C44B|nr:hypothetical protein [Allochromatium vinosum]